MTVKASTSGTTRARRSLLKQTEQTALVEKSGRTARSKKSTVPVQVGLADLGHDVRRNLGRHHSTGGSVLQVMQQNRDAATRPADNRSWWADRPLSEAINAHRTNTKGEMKAALAGRANFLEGDVRTEINPPHRLEMRHDQGHELGDNLYLDEWLKIGAKSGRGLKLDVKDGQRMPEVLAAVERAGVPGERLMFNLGDGETRRWGAEIRRRFPDATIALNPTDRAGKKSNTGPLQDWQVQRLIDQARTLGQPTTFVARDDRLTDRAIRQLEAAGPISVWNDPGLGTVHDVAKTRDELRRRGVSGVIDLRSPPGVVDQVEAAVEKGLTTVQDIWDKIF